MSKRSRKPPPEANEQSGSTGRNPGPPLDNPGVDGKPGSGANTGQGNYGQSGYGQSGYSKGGYGKGGSEKGGPETSSYQKDVPGRLDPDSRSSNRGSGNRHRAEQVQQGERKSSAPRKPAPPKRGT
jgi:hypothetical protein